MAGVSVTLGGNFSKLDELDRKARSVSASIKKGFSERIGHRMFDGLLQVAGSIPAAMKSALDAGGKLSDIMNASGAAGAGIVVMQRALSNAGVEADRTGKILTLTQKAIAGLNEENQSTGDAFAVLGLEMSSLRAMDPVAAFQAIGKAINGISDPAQRTAAALRIFGKSGGELVTVFSDPNAFATAREQLGSLPETLAANATRFDDVSDAIGNAGTYMQQFATGAASVLLPVMERIVSASGEIDLTALGVQVGNIVMQLTRLWPLVVGIGAAIIALKITSLVTSLYAAFAAFVAVQGGAMGAASGIGMVKLALGGVIAVLGMAAMAAWQYAEALAAANQRAQSMQKGNNTFVQSVDLQKLRTTIDSDDSLNAEIDRLNKAREDFRVAQNELIVSVQDSQFGDEQNELKANLDAALGQYDVKIKELYKITPEQMASNKAANEAAAARQAYADAVEKSAKAYDAARKKFDGAVESGNTRRINALPLEEQAKELEAAEKALRGSLNGALQMFHGDATGKEIGDVINKYGDSPTKSKDLETAAEIVAMEQKRAELADKIAEAAAKQAAAAVEYQSSLDIINAQIAGETAKVRILEKEATLRSEIAKLVAAGYSPEEASQRAGAMVDAQERAKVASARRDAAGVREEAAAVGNGTEGRLAQQRRSKEIQNASGVSAKEADTMAGNEARLDRLKTLQSDKEGARGLDVTRASSMAAIGGGGNVYSGGMDYQRQIVDLNREQRDLLKTIAENNGGLFE
jgi:hypothetical protein